MVTENKDIQKEELSTTDAKPTNLPEAFFAKLLDRPSCKTRGICDGCGRCEH